MLYWNKKYLTRKLIFYMYFFNDLCMRKGIRQKGYGGKVFRISLTFRICKCNAKVWVTGSKTYFVGGIL